MNRNFWSKANLFSKGAKRTTWIWNLHAEAHVFEMTSSSSLVIARKIFSSSLAHLALVFFWIGGMAFHGAYFSNFGAWLKDAAATKPSAQILWPLVAQEMLNSDLGHFFQGLEITSGLFCLWRSAGLLSSGALKAASALALFASLFFLLAASFHMHLAYFQLGPAPLRFPGLASALGLGSLAWALHEIAVAIPLQACLDSGLDPLFCPEILDARSYAADFIDAKFHLQLAGSLNPETEGLFLGQIAAHHFSFGFALLLSSSLEAALRAAPLSRSRRDWHAEFSRSLGVLGSLSIFFAFEAETLPSYPFLALDYATEVSLFSHHIWLALFCLLGAGAHASISMLQNSEPRLRLGDLAFLLLSRDILLGHLLWLSIALGLHAFGLYLHNDTLKALGRPEESFSQGGLRLEPLFANFFLQGSFDLKILEKKLV